jgi:tetratricopeptide (TPR) repeat protein
MDSDQTPELRQLDLMIRGGQSALVRSTLIRINRNELQREHLVEYADLARRVQRPDLIIRWLRAVVRPEKPVTPVASVREIAIYALGLSRLGVFGEALDLLSNLPTQDHPQVLFYLGLVHIEQWDYEAAQFPLQKYINRKDISDYQKMAGLLNLAACYVSERNWSKANETLSLLLLGSNTEDRLLIRANTFELLAQSKIFQNQYAEALDYLAQSHAILGKNNIQYEFFIRKWKAIAQFIHDPSTIDGLMNIRQQAWDTRAWETVRECDFFRAQVLRDHDLFLTVYFGSHAKAYRQRILKLYGWDQVLPLAHRLPILKFSPSKNDIIYNFRPTELGLPSLLQELLLILLSDLYRPFPLPELFAKLYPTEYFNPQSSIHKVEQLLQRLRQKLVQKNIPMEICSELGRYFIRANSSVIIERSRKKPSARGRSKAQLATRLHQLHKLFGNRSFTFSEVSQCLQISERSASRLLSEAVKNRFLMRMGGKLGYRFDLQKLRKF